MAQAKGVPAAKRAASVSPSGSKKGMEGGPTKPTAKLASVAKPVIAKGPIAGVKTNRKAQPMYTGKPSAAGKMAGQYGTGIGKANGKAFEDSANKRTAPVKQKLNQG